MKNLVLITLTSNEGSDESAQIAQTRLSLRCFITGSRGVDEGSGQSVDI